MMIGTDRFSPSSPEIHQPRRQAPVDGAPFHTWVRLSDDEPWLEFFRVTEGYLLRFPDFADFQVAPDGLATTCWPTPDIDDVTIHHLFQSHVVPLMASANGRLVLHGGAVEMLSGKDAVAFLGQSGRGKSTLTASFARQGLRFLSDDMLLVSTENGKVVVHPGHPSIRVWGDSLDAVVGATLQKFPSVSYTDKDRISPADEMPFCPEPRPLRAAFLLSDEPSEAIEINRLSGAKALAGWIESTLVLDIEDKSLMRANLDAFVDISQSTPLFALSYPRDFEALPDVRNAVLQASHDAQVNR